MALSFGNKNAFLTTYVKLETSFLPKQIFYDTENLTSVLIKKPRSAVCFADTTLTQVFLRN